MSILDYSQYSKYLFCPWAWYENYINQRSLHYIGQRSDPLCLGSLVHNALDNFAKSGKPFVDDETIKDNDPTPETMQLCELLVMGYLRKYPKEHWPVERAEQPLQFPLQFNALGHRYNDGHMGLAKLDGMFYVPEDTTIESGIPEHTLTLSRGWWGKEYKTKAHGRNRSEWIKEWQTKRQADFQILALTHHLESMPETAETQGQLAVQGILVCVLEKPHEYIPKRKCAGCKASYELELYRPVEHGFVCPACNVVQELSPYIPKVPKIPEYFRISVTRTSEQLAVAKREITTVAIQMESMRRDGMESVIPDRDACVNNVYRRECAYHAPHTYGPSTAEDHRYVTIDATKYMGVVV